MSRQITNLSLYLCIEVCVASNVIKIALILFFFHIIDNSHGSSIKLCYIFLHNCIYMKVYL